MILPANPGRPWMSAAFVGLTIGVLGCASATPTKRVAEDPHQAYEWAVNRINQGKCLKAQETLRLISLEHGGVTYVDSIIYHLARAYMCLGDHALAQIEYERVVNNYPASSLVDDAAFGLAYAQFKQAPRNPGNDQSEAEQAVRTLREFLAIYPSSDRKQEASELLSEMETRLAKKNFDTGLLYLKLGADSSAMIYFQRVWDDYTETEYAARALWLLAERARKHEDWNLAVQRYEQLIAVYSDAIEVKQAESLLRRIKADQAKRLHNHAKKARKDGHLVLARELCEDILEKYPDYKKADEVRRLLENVRSEQAAKDGSGGS